MNHPLTDEIIDEINASMRAVADWQLDRDSEWLKNFLTGSGAFTYGMANSIVEEFRKAMRPQENN